MAQTFSSAGQGVLAINVGSQAAGASILLEDAEGRVLFSYAPELSFGLVILSAPEMTKGERYTITVGGQTKSFAAS